MLYQCAAGSQATALDGVTGDIKWQFDPVAESKNPFWKRCRTLGFYDPGPTDACRPRIVLTTVDTRLISLKASDGAPCESFGNAGIVDLTVDMGQWMPGDPLNRDQTVPTIAGFLTQTTKPCGLLGFPLARNADSLLP
ncbi:MAG: hypothetical protein ACK5LJ_14310 [Paracoccus sp. (in: a-proteobacteria)]